MLIQSIGFRANERHLVDEATAKAAFVKAATAIDAIDETRLREINEEHASFCDDVESYRQTLRSDLTEVEAAALGNHRQGALTQGGRGVVLLLTGGLSWGDSPTELFDSISRLHEAAVLPDARWPESS